ncbi:MAG: serine hydrolase, partial [Anaerolineae bacterium]|nr:serine hydrolase [Anaerolineae bacterium]
MPDLKARVEQAIADSDASIGVAIRHIESGESLYIDADTPVPLASVVKSPVLIEAFRQMGEGRFALSDRWMLTHEHKALG